MEVLGTYDPTPHVPIATDAAEVIDEVTGLPRKPKRYKDIQLDQSRTKYWLGVGAQPSEPVVRILCLVRPFPCLLATKKGSSPAYPALLTSVGPDRTDGAATGHDEESNTFTSTVCSRNREDTYEVVTSNPFVVALRRRSRFIRT